jgi:GxxExxY protein
MGHNQLLHEALTESVIGAFFDVYNILDFGFLEHVYSAALERELRSRGHSVGREVGVEVMYKGEEIASQRLDMVVDDCLVVEIKSTMLLPPTAKRQLLVIYERRGSKLDCCCISGRSQNSTGRF